MKKLKCKRIYWIDAFELCCWRRLLRVPWTARRPNQWTLKKISPECSLEGLMLRVKLQCFVHLMWRANSLEKPWCWERLKAGWEGYNRSWDGQMASLSEWTWVWARYGELMMDREAGHAPVNEVAKSLTWLSDWTELKKKNTFILLLFLRFHLPFLK